MVFGVAVKDGVSGLAPVVPFRLGETERGGTVGPNARGAESFRMSPKVTVTLVVQMHFAAAIAASRMRGWRAWRL